MLSSATSIKFPRCVYLSLAFLHPCILSCGYHIINGNVLVLSHLFILKVDNKLDTCVACHSFERLTKKFDYIPPHASRRRATADSIMRRSARLNPQTQDNLDWILVRLNAREAGHPSGDVFEPLHHRRQRL